MFFCGSSSLGDKAHHKPKRRIIDFLRDRSSRLCYFLLLSVREKTISRCTAISALYCFNPNLAVYFSTAFGRGKIRKNSHFVSSAIHIKIGSCFIARQIYYIQTLHHYTAVIREPHISARPLCPRDIKNNLLRRFCILCLLPDIPRKSTVYSPHERMSADKNTRPDFTSGRVSVMRLLQSSADKSSDLIFFLSGRTNGAETLSSSMPILRNRSVSDVSAASSPHMPIHAPCL